MTRKFLTTDLESLQAFAFNYRQLSTTLKPICFTERAHQAASVESLQQGYHAHTSLCINSQQRCCNCGEFAPCPRRKKYKRKSTVTPTPGEWNQANSPPPATNSFDGGARLRSLLPALATCTFAPGFDGELGEPLKYCGKSARILVFSHLNIHYWLHYGSLTGGVSLRIATGTVIIINNSNNKPEAGMEVAQGTVA